MRFLRVFLLSCAALVVLYVAVAVLVDPRGEFGAGRFPVVVREDLTTKMRLFEAYRRGGPVEGVVLGSSRSMKLSPATLQHLTGLRFFNFAAAAARPEDDLAIYRWLRARARPRQVILGVDVQFLTDNTPPDPALLRNRALLRAYGRRVPGAPRHARSLGSLLHAYQKTLTADYAADVGRSVLAALHVADAGLPAVQFDEDGLLHHPRVEAAKASGTFRLELGMDAIARGMIAQFRSAKRLDPRRVRDLRELIRTAGADGATVTVWLPPFHPALEQELTERSPYPRFLAETRDLLRTLAEQEHVHAYDLSRLDAFGGTADGWLDCLHLDSGNADRAARVLAR